MKINPKKNVSLPKYPSIEQLVNGKKAAAAVLAAATAATMTGCSTAGDVVGNESAPSTEAYTEYAGTYLTSEHTSATESIDPDIAGMEDTKPTDYSDGEVLLAGEAEETTYETDISGTYVTSAFQAESDMTALAGDVAVCSDCVSVNYYYLEDGKITLDYTQYFSDGVTKIFFLRNGSYLTIYNGTADVYQFIAKANIDQPYGSSIFETEEGWYVVVNSEAEWEATEAEDTTVFDVELSGIVAQAAN